MSLQANIDEKLRSKVIGLAKINGRFDLVFNIQEPNQTYDSVTVTQFGAIQRNFGFPMGHGELKLFPDNKTLLLMLDNPFEFDQFIKSFK